MTYSRMIVYLLIVVVTLLVTGTIFLKEFGRAGL